MSALRNFAWYSGSRATATASRAKRSRIPGGNPGGQLYVPYLDFWGLTIRTAEGSTTALTGDLTRHGGALEMSIDIQVLQLNNYRLLTTHSMAELSGLVFVAEYQTFTHGDATIRLWNARRMKSGYVSSNKHA